MTANKSNTFCIYPWLHLSVNPDGAVLPCCVANPTAPVGNLQTSTISEIWNNDRFKKIRLNMLSGKECSECQRCYQSEELGSTSTRQRANDQYQKYSYLVDDTNEDGSLNQITLKYLDIRWSNICNFKCRSCSATYSSSWAQEDVDQKRHERKIFMFAGGNNNDNLYEQLLPYLPEIENFYFAGGEPLLTDKHYDLLEHLIKIDHRSVPLNYNTNLSNLKYKQKSIIDLWKNFYHVQISPSLDSWGDRAEYIRDGTKWKEIEENIQTIKEQTPHVQIIVSTVVSIFNVYTLPEFLKQLESIINNNVPNFYIIQEPEFYSFKILPPKFKDLCVEKLLKINHVPGITEIISQLQQSKYDRNFHLKFINKTKELDKTRNQSFVKTFPELSDIFNDVYKVF
jgi:radical SAM protein with 4Fe4S-binding SPASM domain